MQITSEVGTHAEGTERTFILLFVIRFSPLQAQYDCHVNGGREHDVGDGVDEVGVENGVQDGVELKGPGKGVVGHQEDAEDCVHHR